MNVGEYYTFVLIFVKLPRFATASRRLSSAGGGWFKGGVILTKAENTFWSNKFEDACQLIPISANITRSLKRPSLTVPRIGCGAQPTKRNHDHQYFDF